MNNTYSISFISNACGVQPHTIRTWEKRYKAFSPERTDGGQRIYSEDDLIKGRLIVSLLEQGHPISRLAVKSLQDLRTLVIDEKIESFQSNKNSMMRRLQRSPYHLQYVFSNQQK